VDEQQLREQLAPRYQVEREIGRGGMATVYLARDTVRDRLVAVKVLSDEVSTALGTERFRREIRIAAQLTHPNILPVYDSGEVGEALFFVMPYVEGGSLRSRIAREKQFNVDDAVRVATEVANALDYAHRQGLIHRDVKPENILFADNHAFVADFGVARAINAAGEDRITRSGITLGTPLYMSPEQAAAEADLDGRSDIYSLGCCAYEMLVGAPPFAGPTAQVVMARHSLEQVPSMVIARPKGRDCPYLRGIYPGRVTDSCHDAFSRSRNSNRPSSSVITSRGPSWLSASTMACRIATPVSAAVTRPLMLPVPLASRTGRTSRGGRPGA